MPDMRDALRNAGLKSQKAEARPGRPPDPRNERPNPFPAGYPTYFDSKGVTRVELLTTEAENLADRFEFDKLKRHQLRAFYDHAKRQLQRLEYGAPFGGARPEIVRLKAFAADRAGRTENKLPDSFRQFIDRNVDAVVDEKSFRKGFMLHFEAVVAYCARLRDN